MFNKISNSFNLPTREISWWTFRIYLILPHIDVLCSLLPLYYPQHQLLVRDVSLQWNLSKASSGILCQIISWTLLLWLASIIKEPSKSTWITLSIYLQANMTTGCCRCFNCVICVLYVLYKIIVVSFCPKNSLIFV